MLRVGLRRFVRLEALVGFGVFLTFLMCGRRSDSKVKENWEKVTITERGGILGGQGNVELQAMYIHIGLFGFLLSSCSGY